MRLTTAFLCVLSAPVAVGAMTWAGPGHAAAPSTEERAFATFEAGEAAFRAEDFERAVRLFGEAFDIHPEPAYLFNKALALGKIGRPGDAAAAIQLLLERFPDLPRRAEAERKLNEFVTLQIERRATITIDTMPMGAEAAVVGVDGQRCVTPCSLRVEPGEVVVAIGTGRNQATTMRVLAPKEHWELKASMEAIPAAATDRTAAWVLFGVGGAALATGVGFGLGADAAWQDAKALAAASPLDTADYQRFRAARSDVRRWAAAADIGFGVALGALVGGTIAWFLAEPGDETSNGGFTWRF